MNRVRCAIFFALVAGAGGLRGETLSLLDCLRETAAHNAQIIGRQRDLERASGVRLAFRSQALPRFNIGGIVGQQGERDSERLRIPAVRDASGQIVQPARRRQELRSARFFAIGTESLSQPLFDASIPATWRRGGIEEDIARASFATVAAAQLHSAHVLFVQGLFQQQNGAILREVSESQAANARLASSLVAAGVAGRGRELAAQIQAANAEPAVLAAAGNARSTAAQLLQVMGRPVRFDEDAITLSGALGEAPPEFDPVALGKLALERRPDLASLRESVRRIREDTNTARAGFYPLVTVYIDGQLLPQSLVNDRPNSVRPDDNTRTSELRLGAREDWAVIDTGAVLGNVRRLERLREAAEIALAQAERIVPGQLATVRAQWRSAQRQIDALSGNVAAAEDTLGAIRQSLAQGLVSQSDFLDAQNGVAFARTGLLSARLQASLARAEYDRVTGGYLRYVENNPSSTAQ